MPKQSKMSSSAAQDGIDNVDPSLEDLLKDISSLETIVDTWDEQIQNTVNALKRGIDDLHKEAFARIIRRLRGEPGTAKILKEIASDEVVYAVLRHLKILQPSLNERLEEALDSVRPYLESHGGGVELVEINSATAVTVRLLGACDGCPASGLTLQEGVEKAIKEYCPEIQTIEKAKGFSKSKKDSDAVPLNFVSPFANAADSGWVSAVELDEIPENDIKIIDLNDHSLILSRNGQAVSCFENSCAHLGMPMDMGTVENGKLSCPHHAFEYLLTTGECLTVPEVQLQTHAVRVSGTHVEVKFS